ncbi:MAG: hypothetical protein OS112_03590 [Methanoregula sp.]|nr:MAG: hypothetical protein OS112_03590 [Methanoregula sp.]
MKATQLIAGAFLACCLIGMMVLPASAASGVQGMNVKAAKIDSGLQDDLWKAHAENRLETFDMHVRHAKDIIDVLEAHGINTSGPQAVLDQFAAMRPELEQALNNHDREALKTVNQKLIELTKQFLRSVRDAIRASAGTATASESGIAIPLAGTAAI